MSRDLGTHRDTRDPLIMDLRVFSWSFLARALFVLCFLESSQFVYIHTRTLICFRRHTIGHECEAHVDKEGANSCCNVG